MAVNTDFEKGSFEKNAFKILNRSYSIRDEGTN